MTRDEVEALNIDARNTTRARKDEHGMDWDYWSFFRATETEPGRFSDGHDYAGAAMIPNEGWVPVNTTVTVPVETMVALLRGLEAASKKVRVVWTPKRRVDREQASLDLWGDLRKLEATVCKAAGNPHI